MARILVPLVLILAGCTSKPVRPPEPVIQIREVTKLVTVKATPTEKLVTCDDDVPVPKFETPNDARYVIALTPDEARKLKVLIGTLKVCNDAWHTWATE